MEKVILVMDLGGTNLRLGVVDGQGTVLEAFTTLLSGDRSVEAVSTRISRGIEDLLFICGRKDFLVQGVSLAACGIISREDGRIIFSPQYPGWKEVPLREMVSQRFGLPTILENDANAAAFGEFWKGSGQNLGHVVMFTLGTGVGGGIISHGRIVRGSRGMAGELGHVTVVAEGGRACQCGNEGCLEAYSSATAIVDRIREEWRGGGDSPETAHEACLLARDGHPLSLEIYRQAGFYLGVAMAGAVNILNPEVIVVGGGVMEAWELFMPAAESEMHDRAFRHTDMARKVAVRKAELGTSAGLVGAAGIFWKEGT